MTRVFFRGSVHLDMDAETDEKIVTEIANTIDVATALYTKTGPQLGNESSDVMDYFQTLATDLTDLLAKADVRYIAPHAPPSPVIAVKPFDHPLCLRSTQTPPTYFDMNGKMIAPPGSPRI